MKKVLFCAGILALAASCTEDYESVPGQQAQTKGITFEAVEDASTRGEFEQEGTSYVPFWYAEQDRIDIWSTLTSAVSGGKGNSGSTWDETKFATYKATQSARNGVFTGTDDANTLNFDGSDDENPSKFLALYPAGMTVAVSGDVFTVTGLPDLSAQDQQTLAGTGSYKNSVKFSVSEAYSVNDYDAVGEKVNLNFQRVLPGVVFSTKNADQYTKGGAASIFGNLISVQFTAKGKKGTDGSFDDSTTPALIYNNSDAELTIDASKGTGSISDMGTTPAKTATLKLETTNGLEWSDAARAYMLVAPIQRSGKEEYLEAVYTFKNIEFTEAYPTSKDWVAGTFYNFKSLDINSYAYLVTSTVGDRTLIINDGNFDNIIGSNGKVIWPATDADGSINLTDFTTIICNVDLSSAQLAKLKSFTSLKNLTLNQVKTVPAKMLEGLAANMEILKMPAVTAIDDEFTNNVAFANLKELDLAAYNFESDAVNGYFFNSDTKGTLETLNIAGVTSMAPKFGVERTLSFQGYTALTEVTVKDGVELSANAFSDCSVLAKVNGTVNITNGISAFENDVLLKAISVSGTVIPDKAFNACALLETVTMGDAQVIPTEVGTEAFKATKIKYMDLSKATKIGTSAFENAAEFVGPKKGTDVLDVAVIVVSEKVFASTALKMVRFNNATSIEDGIFNGVTSLIQVKFVKPFTVDATRTTTWTSGMFGTSTNVNLFINKDQAYRSGTTLNLPWTNTSNPDVTSITFKGITVE